MHLVFLNQYYPPDAAPTGVMLEDLADGMVRNGHEVTVLCAAGGYAGGEACASNIEHRTLNVELRREEEEPMGSAEVVQNQQSSIPPSCPLPGVRILRIGASRFGRGSFVGKLLDYGSYYFGVGWTLMTMDPRPDRIVALTTPPYLSLWARVVSKIRGGDHAHWVMDLYPDVMVAHGMVRERGVVHRMLAALARWGVGGKRCAAVVTLGPDMAERMEAGEGRNIELRTLNVELREGEKEVKSDSLFVIGKEEEGEGGGMRGEGEALHIQHSTFNNQQSSFNTITWVPLWGAAGELSGDGFLKNEGHGQDARATVEDLRGRRGWEAGDLVVMYSGNMGLGHCFGEILAAARTLEEHSWKEWDEQGQWVAGAEIPQKPTGRTRFVFFGEGKRRGEILEFMDAHPHCAVELHGYAPADILDAHLLSADVHLVSLRSEWTGTMVPSKLQGVFRLGRPVIFIGSAASSIGRWVTESGGGWVVETGDAAGLLKALDEARDPDARMRRGRAARDFARIHFDREINVGKLVEFFGP